MRHMRIIRFSAFVACMAALLVAATAGATTVTPANETFNLTTSGTIRISNAFALITCSGISATGTIPASPDNSSPAANGSVVVPISAPSLTRCVTEGGLGARVSTFTTFGNWTMTFVRIGGRPLVVAMTIPSTGVLIEISTFFNCIMSAPFGRQTPISGRLATGARFIFGGQQAALTQTGAICPERGPAVNITGEAALVDSRGRAISVS